MTKTENWEKILLKKVYEVKGTPEERLMDFYEFTVLKINQLKAKWEKEERKRVVGLLDEALSGEKLRGMTLFKLKIILAHLKEREK